MAFNKEKEAEMNKWFRPLWGWVGIFFMVYAVAATATLLIPLLPAIWFDLEYFSTSQVSQLVISGALTGIMAFVIGSTYLDDELWR